MDRARRFQRMDIDEPVGVYAGDNYKVEKGRQFSEGGMLFETLREFTQGQHITLTFQLSDTVLVRFEGEVAYIFKPVPGKQMSGPPRARV